MRKLHLIFITALLIAAPAIAANVTIIMGKISASNGEPIPGAAITARVDGKFLGGIVSSTDGRYILKLPVAPGDSLGLKVSSIGYETKLASLMVTQDTNVVDIILCEKPIAYGAITVNPEAQRASLVTTMGSNWIGREASHSMIATNPISAIQQPQVIREGSNHSSKLRINGTSPTYYLNGVEMGCDPNHYGMFSIVPGSVIDQMRFFPQGTNASLSSPSVIEFRTLQPFDSRPRSEMDLSFIEGTGSLAMGNSRFYLLSTARKSVLDKLADKLIKDTRKMTIPPTDFRDIFISAGFKASASLRLLLDHYDVKDFLSYNLGGTVHNPNGIHTVQSTGERYWGLRLEGLYSHLSFKISGATKESSENYYASSVGGNNLTSLLVDLGERSRTDLAACEINLLFGATRISAGGNLKYVQGREISLHQVNWNFLPPDANSDNPFIYQTDLNRFYGSYSSAGNQLSNAGYVSLKQSLGPIEIESGIRGEYFGELGQKSAFLCRNSINFKSDRFGDWETTLGTYVNDPTGKILESYQVLILENARKLRPVETNLAAISWAAGPVKLEAFKKNINYLPRFTPDFKFANAAGATSEDFLSIRSDGQINSYGADISLELKNVKRFDIYTYYGFTHADMVTNDITVPYELNSPHKFFAQVSYEINRFLNVGGSFSLRTGFPYTGEPTVDQSQNVSRYTENYYRGVIGSENSVRFPINLNSDLYGNLNLGHCQIYASLSNISNHKNPIISTANGFVYDAGILPSLGLKYKF
jgi:hypothetical protein